MPVGFTLLVWSDNNQYMVVDYKLFSPGQPLVPNTLWVVEQIPGLVVGSCLTLQLERGYFPSYNIPNFAQVGLRTTAHCHPSEAVSRAFADL